MNQWEPPKQPSRERPLIIALVVIAVIAVVVILIFTQLMANVIHR